MYFQPLLIGIGSLRMCDVPPTPHVHAQLSCSLQLFKQPLFVKHLHQLIPLEAHNTTITFATF